MNDFEYTKEQEEEYIERTRSELSYGLEILWWRSDSDLSWENYKQPRTAYQSLDDTTLYFEPMKNLYGRFFEIRSEKNTYKLAFSEKSDEEFDKFISEICDYNRKYYSATEYEYYVDDPNALDFLEFFYEHGRETHDFETVSNNLSYFENLSNSLHFSDDNEKRLYTDYIALAKKHAMVKYFAIKNMPQEQVEKFRNAKITEAKKIIEEQGPAYGNMEFIKLIADNSKYDYFNQRGEFVPRMKDIKQTSDIDERINQLSAVYKYYTEQMQNASTEEVRKYMLECTLEPKYVQEFENEYNKRFSKDLKDEEKTNESVSLPETPVQNLPTSPSTISPVTSQPQNNPEVELQNMLLSNNINQDVRDAVRALLQCDSESYEIVTTKAMPLINDIIKQRTIENEMKHDQP